MRPNIDLHIEELILQGFASSDRYHIGAALERELARLFAEQGVSPSLLHGGTLPHLNGGSFLINADTQPDNIGVQVAQTIYNELSNANIKSSSSNDTSTTQQTNITTESTASGEREVMR